MIYKHFTNAYDKWYTQIRVNISEYLTFSFQHEPHCPLNLLPKHGTYQIKKYFNQYYSCVEPLTYLSDYQLFALKFWNNATCERSLV